MRKTEGRKEKIMTLWTAEMVGSRIKITRWVNDTIDTCGEGTAQELYEFIGVDLRDLENQFAEGLITEDEMINKITDHLKREKP
jgi:hypothetical protein